jgi:hypothetical protein
VATIPRGSGDLSLYAGANLVGGGHCGTELEPSLSGSLVLSSRSVSGPVFPPPWRSHASFSPHSASLVPPSPFPPPLRAFSPHHRLLWSALSSRCWRRGKGCVILFLGLGVDLAFLAMGPLGPLWWIPGLTFGF